MFQRAIVKLPCAAMAKGLTSHPELGAPDYTKALAQHAAYQKVLKDCGLDVTVLPADEAFPDSCFVEDPALLTPQLAIVTSPGAPSRHGETEAIEAALEGFYPSDKIRHIFEPGTLDGGDVMFCDATCYVGVSARTNPDGVRQLSALLTPLGYAVIPVKLHDGLHLKSSVAYLGHDTLLATGELLTAPEFRNYKKIEVLKEEEYAANCVDLNGTIVVPEGFPKTRASIDAAGFKTVACDVSEFRKLDGGLSCLSLRF